MLDNVADGIVTVGDDGVIESFNRAASELFGYGEQEAIGQPFAMMVGPKQPRDFASDAEAKRQTPDARRAGQRSAESIGRRKDGSTFPMELDLSDVQLGSGTIHIGCLRDISERQTLHRGAPAPGAARQPHRPAQPRALRRPRRRSRSARRCGREDALALLLLDLDELQAGQRHARAPARRRAPASSSPNGSSAACASGTPSRDWAATSSGSCWAASTDLAGAATVVWKLQQALEPPFEHRRPRHRRAGEHRHHARAASTATTSTTCCGAPTWRCTTPSGSGTGYALFATEQEETPARRLALLGDLRHCIERDELVLHYQPKIDLATQETTGVEALIRWNHPSGRAADAGRVHARGRAQRADGPDH